MSLEIERRFLVNNLAWKKLAGPPTFLKQGYLSGHQEIWTIRARISPEERKAWLTLKSPVDGCTNHEFEYAIPIEDAEAILAPIPNKITKTRYQLNLNGGEWVVDCFHEKNAPLIIAEVELSSTKTNFRKPSWCKQEITGEHQWSNAALAQTPFSERALQMRLKDKTNTEK